MPIFTFKDLKTKRSAKPAKEVGNVNPHDGEYVQLGRRSEGTGAKTKKGTNQDKDEDKDGDYHEKPEEESEEDGHVVGVSRGKSQEQGSSKDGNVNGDGYVTFTPRQMPGHHWANKDFKASPTNTKQAAVEKEQNEELQADQVAGMNEHGGGEEEEEAEAGMNDTEHVARKLRDGKKNDIGQRLGDH